MRLNEELFTSFQETEENFAISNGPIRNKAIDKQKFSGENRFNTGSGTLTDYINVLEHSLLVEDINGHIQSKKAKNCEQKFRNICEVEPSFHACWQPCNDVTTSDYASNNQLTSLKYLFSEDKVNYNEIAHKINFPESHSDIGITNLKTATHEESLADFEINSFQSKTTSVVYNFDCLGYVSPIQDYSCVKVKERQKHINKNREKNCQVESIFSAKKKEQLTQCCSQKNKRTKPVCIMQSLTVVKKKLELNQENKIYSGENKLKTKECAPMFNNHFSIKNGEFAFLIPNSCGSENSLIQDGIRSKRSQRPIGSKSKQCKISDDIFSKMQKPLKIITYRKNVNKNMKSAAIEQTLVTVKRKQKIKGVKPQIEEKTLIKALTAPRNGNRISIKSSVLTTKHVNYKCISTNTPNKKQLKCSTPVNAAQHVAFHFHCLSSINPEENIELPSFLSLRKNVAMREPLINDTDSIAATNSFRTQKFILSKIDRSLSFTAIMEDEDQDFIELLSYCEHGKIVLFLKAYTWSDFLCTKIGEGSYGEVFSLANKSKNVKVLKVIPLAVSKSQNSQNVSCKDIKHEIAVCRYMNNLRDSLYNAGSNFIKMNKVTCASGNFPSQLKRAWCRFKKIHRSKSFNPHPGTYVDDQIFIIFEFEFGGETLENYKIKSASEALSIFHQITMSLAVAEVECFFEHRDLHLSNVLITTSIAECIDYRIEGTLVGVPSSNVLVKIIDFTLSRLTTQEGFVLSANINEGDSLFLQFGDEQYEIYRKTDRYLGGNWKAFCPYTNIMWLHYILKNILSRNSVKKTNTDSEKIILHYLQNIEKELLQYKSAKDYVLKILI